MTFLQYLYYLVGPFLIIKIACGSTSNVPTRADVLARSRVRRRVVVLSATRRALAQSRIPVGASETRINSRVTSAVGASPNMPILVGPAPLLLSSAFLK